MADTRSHILDASLLLFSRDGFDATSIREIAEEARVATGLLHHHFGSKTAVLLAVAERIALWCREYRAVKAAKVADLPLEDRIRAYVYDSFELACLRPDHVRLLGMAMYSQEIWEDAKLSPLLWETLSINVGELVEEYVEKYPERGMPAVMQTGIGIFGACFARCVVAGSTAVPETLAASKDSDKAWCKTMTKVWVGPLFLED